MATTVEELEVRITAKMGELNRALRQVEQRTKRSSTAMQASFAGVGAMVGKLTAAISALGLGALAVGSVRATAEMENLEIAMASVFGGIDQGKSAVQFIQKFATKTPFDIQTLSKAFIQLGGAGVRPTEKLLTTLGNAASVTVNELQTFEALTRIITRGLQGGLGLEELEMLVTAGIPVYKILNEQLGITRDEVSKLGQTADGAQKIIDSLLTGLDAEFGGAMEARSQALSVSLSNLGIAANTALITIGKGGLRDAVQDVTERMSSALEGSRALLLGIGDGLGRAVTATANAVRFLGENLKTIAGIMAVTAGAGATIALTKAIINLRKAFQFLNLVVRRSPMGLIAVAMGLAVSQIDAVKEKVDELGMAVLEMVGDLFPAPSSEDIKKFEDLELANQKVLDAITAANQGSGLFKDSLKSMGEEASVVKAQILGMSEELAKAIAAEGIDPTKFMIAPNTMLLSSYDKDSAKVAELVRQLGSLNQAREQLARIERGVQAVEEKGISQKTKLKKLIGDIEQAEIAGRVSTEDAGKAIAQLNHEIKLLDPVTKGMTEAFDAAGDALGDSLTEAINQGKLSLRSFRDMVRQMAVQLLNEYLKLQVFKPLFSGVGNALSSAFGFPSTPPAQSASGGSSRVGVPTLVGERGPEMFIPSAGRIMNAHDTRKAMGGSQGVAIVQNFNLSAGVVPTVRLEVENMMPAIQARTIAAVAEGQRRG